VEERSKEQCAIEARSRLLWKHNTTGSKVVKATPNLRSKGLGGQQHGARKAKRVKYLNRVGQLGRLW
jgi:hypothetical protein